MYNVNVKVKKRKKWSERRRKEENWKEKGQTKSGIGIAPLNYIQFISLY